MAVNDTRGAALGILVQFLKGPKIHVVNLAAFSTHKMIMLSGVPIKMIGAVPAGQLPYLSGFNQQVQVTIDCSQADVGKFFTDAGV